MLRRRLARIGPDFAASLIIGFGLLAFVPSLTGYFLADDFVLLSWTRTNSISEVAGFFDPNVEWFYRPFVKFFYWSGQGVFGLRAAPFHLISLLLHGLNGYLVYRLVLGAEARGRGWVVGLAAGLLFLLNSHHAETVSWIAAIGDLSGLVCVLVATLLFRRYLSSGRWAGLVASVGVFALGLLTRETVVVLPFLLLLYAFIARGAVFADNRGAVIKRLALGLIPHATVLLVYLLVVVVGRGSSGGLGRGGLAFRALNIDSILLGVFDFVHGLIPGGRSLASLPLETMRTVIWIEALAALAFVALLLWKRQRLALFGLIWMLATPLLFVFFSGPTDRYFYLPSVGYAIFAAGLVGWLVRFLSSRLTQDGRVARAIGAFVLAVMLLTQARDLTVKEASWHAAGKVSGGVYNDVKKSVPVPGDGGRFYFVGLPMFMDSVPVFQNALPSGLHALYGNRSLAGFAVTCDELQPGRLEESAYAQYLFQFKGDGVGRILKPEDCRP